MDIALTKAPIAMVITPSNNLKFHKIKLIHDKFFIIPKLGVYEIDPTARPIKCDKSIIYFYDSRSPKSVDPFILKEIDYYAKKNGLEVIKRKDVRQGSRLRKILLKNKMLEKTTDALPQEITEEQRIAEGLKQLQEEEQEKQAQIQTEIESINTVLIEDNKRQMEKGEPPTAIDPDDYSSYIIDTLVTKKLISLTDAVTVKTQLIRGEISIDDFIKRLVELNQVEINTPIPLTVERWFDAFHSYDPAMVDAFIDRGERIGDKIKKMGSPVVKNMTPILYIAIIIIIAVVVTAIVAQTDMSQFKLPDLKGMIPGIPKFLFGLFRLF